MLENGKILVVVAVLAFILAGVFVYLFTIDRKVTKLEKEVEEKTTETEK
jgi:CcmD family protein